VAGACECGEKPSGSVNTGNFLTSYRPVSFSRKTLLPGVSKYVAVHDMKAYTGSSGVVPLILNATI
jgi:hypothetical protein